MKACVISFFTCIVLFACSKNKTEIYDNASLIGNWKEYEAYSDPGDGSGSYQEVDGIVLNIKADSSYTTSKHHFVWGRSGRITMVNDSTVNIIDDTQPARLFFATFSPTNAGIQFSYTCIEGCGSRFRKVNAD